MDNFRVPRQTALPRQAVDGFASSGGQKQIQTATRADYSWPASYRPRQSAAPYSLPAHTPNAIDPPQSIGADQWRQPPAQSEPMAIEAQAQQPRQQWSP